MIQDKLIQNRNISKKRSEKIKIPKKMGENINDTNHNYISNKNNNTILMNKSNVKIDINKNNNNNKKTNLRSISHSTKCIIKIQDRYKEREKYQPLIKNNNKFSKTKENIKESKEKKNIISKINKNSQDIFIKKNINNDLHNHSFNFFRKAQNTHNNSNSHHNNNKNNNSLKNIEFSCNNKPQLKNNEDNNDNNKYNVEHKKKFMLPFYYTVKIADKQFNLNDKKKKINNSNKNDYYNILQNLNLIPLCELAAKIVGLPERKWLCELKDNLALIEKNKSINFESSVLNAFIKGRLIIQEDFNWLLWAVSYVYQKKIIIKEGHLKQIENDKNANTEIKINYNKIEEINNNLSLNDSDKWRKGFIYNGVYFRLLNKKENYNEIRKIKREIKSLNLLFLDYIQLLDNIPANINDIKPLLTNNIIFPLLNIAECSNYYIMASLPFEPSFLNKVKNNNNNNNISKESNGEYNYYYIHNNIEYFNKIVLSEYNLKNLKNSPFFANLAENNLINVNEGKFIIVNVAEDLHPLLVPKNIDEDENMYDDDNTYNDYNDYIFLKYPLITNLISKEDNFYNKSSFLIYFKYFINYLTNNKYITDMPSLEYEMNKFGINKCFYLFILSRVKFNNSCDIETNNNISSLIKIYILVKLLAKIEDVQFITKNNKNTEDKNDDINNRNSNSNNNNNVMKTNVTEVDKENKSETSCGTSNAKNNNSKTNIRFNTEKKNELYINFNEIFNKEKENNNNNRNTNKNNDNNNRDIIRTISQLILFILSPKSSLIEINIKDLVHKLLYQSHIYLEKFKKINNKLFSNDVSSLYENKSFLKSLIISARNYPLIFLSQIENKFNILFNYQIKYVTSICLENFIKYFNINQIIEKDPKIISYINAEELGFYLIIKNISSMHQKNKSNCFQRKGSKMIKNISSDNMDIYGGNAKYNYDHLSILNRSIIQPRNSNFRILNSSKDKPKIKSLNNIHMATTSNSNSKRIHTNFNKSKDNTLLISSNNNISGSLNSNTNESNSKLNNNILASYKNNQTQTNSNSNNYNVSLVENFALSSSSKDMFEFNYGDEDSEKSFNFNVSYGDTGLPINHGKKRNTTNVNNSKFNLNNNNRINNSGNNCKTISAKNYNTNNNKSLNNINNIVINSKNSIDNMTPSGSSGTIGNQNNKIHFCNENKGHFWKNLFNNYHLKFPYNLYKVATQNAKASLLIYKYLSIYYSFFPNNNNFNFIKNPLRDNSKNVTQEIDISEMLNEQKQILESIFSDIISINPKSCYLLINFYFYYIINYYFVENEQFKKCEKIIVKINNLFKNKILYKQNNYNIIINLLNVFVFDKNNFLKADRYCNKALILSLIQYGEPRGRNNDGNNIMLFPVWKTGRNCTILDNNDILNENYKELYHCLFYLYDNKRSNKSSLNDLKESKLIDKNIINDLFRNIEFIKKNYKKNQKSKKNQDEVHKKPFDYKNNNNYKKNNSGNSLQKYLDDENEDTFFNFDDEEMLERPSKLNNDYDEFFNISEDNNTGGINSPIYFNNINNILNKTHIINQHESPINNYININSLNSNCKIIPMINTEYTFDLYFRENSTLPDIIFPSINDKRLSHINSFISSEKFFIYLVKAIFGIINYSSNEFTYTNEYCKQHIFSNDTLFSNSTNNMNNNNNSSNNNPSKLKKLSFFTKILSDNLYYKKFAQSNIIVSFGNNPHCETGHKGYKFLSLPRVLYHLKNKEIISIKSGWEHSIAQDIDKMLYSWGNNSCCQCGFDSNETTNMKIYIPRNISELNDKNIIEISCGNEHTLALSYKGEVYSWGSISDGVLGREIPKGKENCSGLALPGKINYFIKNKIKIRQISSGSIHNLCLDDKSNLYSFGCSKGGQLGLDEKELSLIYKKKNNFYVGEPRLIKSLKDIEIIKISSGEAHNVALSIDGKCYVWGFGSNGQLGLGFCEDYFPSGEGMKRSKIYTPTILKEFDKNNNKISKIFCGKTFTIFLNKKDELYSTGINDLNQCGIDNKSYINEYLCYDIVTPIKIEMFIKMKIINVSCGESHVLAITEDNGIRTLFSWGSNRFGQLGQGIQTKQSMPKIVNYFLYYNNSEVFQVSCGAFHSLALLRSKDEENVNKSLDEKYIFDNIDKS